MFFIILTHYKVYFLWGYRPENLISQKFSIRSDIWCPTIYYPLWRPPGSSVFCDWLSLACLANHNQGVNSRGDRGGQSPPPKFWQNRRPHQATAECRITTCSPSFRKLLMPLTIQSCLALAREETKWINSKFNCKVDSTWSMYLDLCGVDG